MSAEPSSTISSLLGPRLRALNSALLEALPRVERGDDPEAVHDLRVAIRRLRSILKPVRRVYGKGAVDAVRNALKGVADATGELRDEEVLTQLVADLTLPPEWSEARASWLAARAPRLPELRARLLASLRSGDALLAAAALASLLDRPVQPRRDRQREMFALKAVNKARAAVDRLSEVSIENEAGLHQLRILYKRLRYLVEAFEGALPPAQASMAKSSARYQKWLGDIHDLDIARMVIAADTSLADAEKAAFFGALAASRERAIAGYVAERTRVHTPKPQPHE